MPTVNLTAWVYTSRSLVLLDHNLDLGYLSRVDSEDFGNFAFTNKQLCASTFDNYPALQMPFAGGTLLQTEQTALAEQILYGTSPNAVKTQIWITISVYLLVAIIKRDLNLERSLNKILQILSTLFE